MYNRQNGKDLVFLPHLLPRLPVCTTFQIMLHLRERRKDTHFTSLMQILLHRSQTGVSRDYLEDVLFGDRDIENRHQALQTIMYKAKRTPILFENVLPDIHAKYA